MDETVCEGRISNVVIVSRNQGRKGSINTGGKGGHPILGS